MNQSTEDIDGSSRRILRRALIARREALDPDSRRERSARIEARIEALMTQLAPVVVGFCWPYRGEFDARGLMLRMLAGAHVVALPVVDGDHMFFRAWTAASDMATDRHGIAYPLRGARVVPQLVLMPLVGFDGRGYRLGYGGGYFDRTLAALDPRPIALGVGFELSRLDELAAAPWDIPCDYVITEAGTWLRCDGKLRAWPAADAGRPPRDLGKE